MRSVTPRGLGRGWVGPRAGVAWSCAAPAGGCCGSRVPSRGEAESVRPPPLRVPLRGLGLQAASLLGLPRDQAGWAPARARLRLRSPRAVSGGGADVVPPLPVALQSPMGQLLRAAGLLL